MAARRIITIEDGTLNVYADLGYPDGAAMQRKSRLAAAIARTIEGRHLTQSAAADLLGIDQAKVSRITRGQYRGVSEGRLLDLLARLGRDVTIVIGPPRSRAGRITVEVA